MTHAGASGFRSVTNDDLRDLSRLATHRPIVDLSAEVVRAMQAHALGRLEDEIATGTNTSATCFSRFAAPSLGVGGAAGRARLSPPPGRPGYRVVRRAPFLAIRQSDDQAVALRSGRVDETPAAVVILPLPGAFRDQEMWALISHGAT